MRRYTKTKVIRISETQLNTLVKMKSFNVNVGDFIRDAIKEKIHRDYEYLIEKKEIKTDSFLNSLNEAINNG